jgi:hypothetical protein
MNIARALPTLAAAVVLTGGCSATPDAADLVAAQGDAGAQVSEAEAAAALLDYVGAVNAALRSGDTETLAAMTGPRCPCQDLVALVEDSFADGGALVDASFDAGAVTVLGRSGRQARVRAQVSVSEYAVHNGDGLVVGSEPAQEYVATYTVRMVGDDAWRVVDVRPTAPPRPPAG